MAGGLPVLHLTASFLGAIHWVIDNQTEFRVQRSRRRAIRFLVVGEDTTVVVTAPQEISQPNRLAIGSNDRWHVFA